MLYSNTLFFTVFYTVFFAFLFGHSMFVKMIQTSCNVSFFNLLTDTLALFHFLLKYSQI